MLSGMEEIGPPFTHERVWAWCAQTGELAVEERLAPPASHAARPWNNDDLRKHARAWLRKKKWDRERASEALAKRAVVAAWFAAMAAAVSALTALVTTIYLLMPHN
jgi:hypothetical protein